MRTYNIHEAKTHLSRLVDEAEKGESFIIAKAGKPKVKVVRIEAKQEKPIRRIGFLKGQIKVPDDIKTPFAKEIEEMFYGKE
ncbi:MAG TPA: type II toxin-antitoxin system prevent-host-death family antitoxin [Terracidiphilus sp.]|jgi:prevent-host-death family protein|nr:type II toxin-antitoxin system prevent-host-death family antitoxin [Terracidiphilus sp.]